MSSDQEIDESPSRQGKRAPVRYFDYPLFTDPWFLFGLALLGSTIALVTWVLASTNLLEVSLSAVPTLSPSDLAAIARDAMLVLLIIILIAWVLPPTARLWRRLQRLREQVPTSAVPGFLPDPIYRDSLRYWTGEEWSEYIKTDRRIPWLRNVGLITVGCIAFVTIQILGAQTDLQAARTWGAYTNSIDVYSNYIDSLPADVETLPWDDYAEINIAAAPQFVGASQQMESALSQLEVNNLDGIPRVAIAQYSSAYSKWSLTLNQVAQRFEQCSLSDEQCLIDAYDPFAERFARDWDALIAETESFSELVEDIQ